MTIRAWLLPFSLGTCLLQAQAPLVMDAAEALRKDEVAWAWPAGTRPSPLDRAGDGWGLRQAGWVSMTHPEDRWVPLTAGQGMGTVLRGQGAAVELGGRSGALEVACQGLVINRPDGSTVGRLLTGYMALRTRSGWRVALEQMPMKWGFGPVGGHLLGTSARPFPALRMTTRVFRPTVSGVALGAWQFDVFTGRLEGDRHIPAWMGGHWTMQTYADRLGGTIAHPFQSGWRILGAFQDRVELQLGVTTMWGGTTPQGLNMMEGRKWYEYILAASGGQNATVAEGAGDPHHPDARNFRDMSNGIGSLNVRVRTSTLARWLGAQGAYVYYERSGENINFQWKDFFRNPLKAVGQDLDFVWEKTTQFSLKRGSDIVWRYDLWKSTPSFSAPTHALGIQVAWDQVQVGAEYRDSGHHDTNQLGGTGYQTYQNGTFLAGHSRWGDCLGVVFGGNVVAQTLHGDWQPTSHLTCQARLSRGIRMFREDPRIWASHAPSQPDPVRSTFLNLEVGLQHRFASRWRWGGALGVMRVHGPGFLPSQTTGASVVFSLVRRFSSGRRATL